MKEKYLLFCAIGAVIFGLGFVAGHFTRNASRRPFAPEPMLAHTGPG